MAGCALEGADSEGHLLMPGKWISDALEAWWKVAVKVRFLLMKGLRMA